MKASPIERRILYEDNHLLIVNKLPGEIVQGDKTGDTPLSETLKQYIKRKYAKPGNVYLGVVHRLDRPTSGAVIFAKTSKALARLNKMLKDRRIHKTYWAVVEGHPDPPRGRLEHYLKKNPKTNKTTVFARPTPGAKKAALSYETLRQGDRYSLVEIDLETGRHHQIRAQMAKIGHPVKGDLKYGAKRSLPGGGIMLHARKLRFPHPVKDTEVVVEAPLPDAHWDITE
ncbi:MAG: RluA family pseudouridine synthase, partial [Chlorobi bacterium]|nr:RluA family pseudouridine synthase [Chlorobiota bacterium]